MKLELTMMSVDNLQQNDYDKIAKPLVHKMQLLKPTLIDKLDSYVPIKVSLSLTIFVFIGNLLLHILVMYLYHKFKFIRNLTDTKIPVKQVMSVTKDQFPLLQSMDHKLKRKITFINESTTDEEIIQDILLRLNKIQNLVDKHHKHLIQEENQRDAIQIQSLSSSRRSLQSQSRHSVHAREIPHETTNRPKPNLLSVSSNIPSSDPPTTTITGEQRDNTIDNLRVAP